MNNKQKRSTDTDAATFTGDRLKQRHRGERGGFGTQHPWAEPDARNKGEFADSVKLRFIEASFRAYEERRRPWRKACCRLADRLAGAALVSQDEPARWRPGRQHPLERLRRFYLGNRHAFALLCRFDRMRPQPLE